MKNMKRKPIFILDTNIVKAHGKEGNLFKHFDRHETPYEIYLPEYVIREMDSKEIGYQFKKKYKILGSSIVDKTIFNKIIESAFGESLAIRKKDEKIDFKDTIIWEQIKISSTIFKKGKNIDIYFITDDYDFLRIKKELESEFKKENEQEIEIFGQGEKTTTLFNLAKKYRDRPNIAPGDEKKILSLIEKNEESILLKARKEIENKKNLSPPIYSGNNKKYQYLFFEGHSFLLNDQDKIAIETEAIEDNERDGVFSVPLYLSAQCIGVNPTYTILSSGNYSIEYETEGVESNVSPEFRDEGMYHDLLSNPSEGIRELTSFKNKKCFLCFLNIDTQEEKIIVEDIEEIPYTIYSINSNPSS